MWLQMNRIRWIELKKSFRPIQNFRLVGLVIGVIQIEFMTQPNLTLYFRVGLDWVVEMFRDKGWRWSFCLQSGRKQCDQDLGDSPHFTSVEIGQLTRETLRQRSTVARPIKRNLLWLNSSNNKEKKTCFAPTRWIYTQYISSNSKAINSTFFHLDSFHNYF